jgi:hypothetical protein
MGPFLALRSSLARGLEKRMLVELYLMWIVAVRTLVDVWKDTTLCDSDVSEKLVQLLIVSDGKLEMTWDDTGLLVVTSSVTGQLEDFGSEVLKDGSEVDRGTWDRLV